MIFLTSITKKFFEEASLHLCQRCMDVSLHFLCLWCLGRVCVLALEEKEKLFEKKEKSETNRRGGKVASHEKGGLPVRKNTNG